MEQKGNTYQAFINAKKREKGRKDRMRIRTFRNNLKTRKQWTTCSVYNMYTKFSLGKIILSVFCDLNWEWSFKFTFKKCFKNFLC